MDVSLSFLLFFHKLIITFSFSSLRAAMFLRTFRNCFHRSAILHSFFFYLQHCLSHIFVNLCVYFSHLSTFYRALLSLSLSLSLFILYVVIFFSFRSDSRSILFPDFPLSLEYVQTIYLISASTFRARPISLISLISFKSDSRLKVLGDCGVRLTSYWLVSLPPSGTRFFNSSFESLFKQLCSEIAPVISSSFNHDSPRISFSIHECLLNNSSNW